MNPIETRGEARKRKDRERKAAKRNNPQFRKLENNRSQQHMAKLRQDLNYVGMSNILQNKRRIVDQGVNNHLSKNLNINVPWYTLELDHEFELMLEQHAAWPQLISPEISKNALAEFRDKINFDKL